MRTLMFLILMSTTGCMSFGPDYGPAKRFCNGDDRGGFKEGNPVYFTCNDGSKYERSSHKNYNFVGRESDPKPVDKALECIDTQVKLYNDLCAESSSGYEYLPGHEAHLLGVECAVDYFKYCYGDGK